MRPAQNLFAGDVRAASRDPASHGVSSSRTGRRRCRDRCDGRAYDDVVPVAVWNAADLCPHRPIYRSAVVGPHAGILRAAGGDLRSVVANYALDVAALTLGVSGGGFGVYGSVHDEASTGQRQHH